MRPKVREDHPFLLSTAPVSRAQSRAASGVLGLLGAAMLVTVPFAQVPIDNSQVLVPAYAIAVFIVDLITAALLLAMYSVQRSRAVLALAIGYLFSGAMVLPWALTFPGVAQSLGLPEAGLQTTAAIATLRRLGFPLLVLAYALMKETDPDPQHALESERRVIAGTVAAVIAIVGGLTWLVLTSEDALPRFMQDENRVTAHWRYVPVSAMALCGAGLFALWVRRRCVLDIWLMVVLCTLLIEIILLAYLSSGRLSIGWWAGRLFGVVSASIVLVVLLAETMTLYARLARSILAERRARETRLTALGALSATIAHEINQPLASMVTNANAGLRWLGRPDPDLAEVRAALERIVDDGHRSASVIEGIRAMFKKGTQERVCVNVNDLVTDIIRRDLSEAKLGRITMQTDLDPHLPAVTGNPVQLQQVISNLVANAIDALSNVTDRERLLRVRSSQSDADHVLVSVEDSGTGLDPALRERIFEPFQTTKTDGMGMGLMFCRSVIEAHGGRIWVMDNAPNGAIFRFTLPSAEELMSLTGEATP
ncbi:sensor histidine kinase [Mesorhizobium xinjiangense]|uniref:sensor histidine kinase n=1 Tax=Mesorhizobium xinjiangense TaxID=2678685 RepID=UPI001F2E58EE|nr:MASE4 domain-containing protein [Mesorhizobium xinjiangense]